MKYIDIHCHLDFPDYGSELPGVLARMKEGGVGAITIGTDLESSKRAVAIADQNENVWACIGIHPTEKEIFDEQEFARLVSNSKVVAIGECGLDFFRLQPEKLAAEKARQRELFKKQIDFALKYDKALMLHCRETYGEVLEILGEYSKEFGDKLRGNAHFFAGNTEEAGQFLDLGFTMSFTGVITFTSDYNEVIKYLPLDSIMSETDAPFVAPVPYRGKRNEPGYVIQVVNKLAELKGLSVEEMKVKMVANAVKMFGLQK